MILATYTAAETPNAFQWAGQPPKWPLPMGDLDPSNTRLFGPTRLTAPPPNCSSIGSAVFTALMNVTNRQTGTQTDHATPSVAIGRIKLLLQCYLIIKCLFV